MDHRWRRCPRPLYAFYVAPIHVFFIVFLWVSGSSEDLMAHNAAASACAKAEEWRQARFGVSMAVSARDLCKTHFQDDDIG